MIYFGENIRYLRNKAGLKVHELAVELNLSRTQLTNYENSTSFPKFLDLIEIAKYFDVNEGTLIHDNISAGPVKSELDNDQASYIISLQKKHIEKLEMEILSLKKDLEPYNCIKLIADPPTDYELKKKNE